MMNNVQIRQRTFIMKVKRVNLDFMLFYLSNVDEAVSGEAPQRNDHTRGAAGVWSSSGHTDGSVKSIRNPFTEPLTNSGHRDIGVHKGSKSWMGDGAQLSDVNVGIDLGGF